MINQIMKNFTNFRTKLYKFWLRYDWLHWISVLFVSLTLILIAVIVIFLIIFSIPFFKDESFASFFGTTWDPKNNVFGIGNFILSTFWTIFLTVVLVVIFTIFSAVFISKFIPNKLKEGIMFFFQVLSGVPSVLFGMFGTYVLVTTFEKLGIDHAKSMITVIIVLTIMVLPTTIILTINILDSVSQKYEFASYALGVDKVTTIFQIVRKFFNRKILLVLLYGFCRSIGEVTAISLIAGNGPTAPPLDQGFEGFFFHSITTLSSLIGLEMAESLSDLHESALFSVGLLLLLIVFIANLLLFLMLKIKLGKIRNFAMKKCGFKHKILFQQTPRWQQNLLFYYSRVRIWFQKFMMWFSFIFIMAFFVWIFGDIVFNGIKHFRFDWLIAVDGEAALLAVIVSTIILIISSVIIAFPFAFFVAIFISEYGNQYKWLRKFSKALYFFVRQLSSSPTIIFGMFGLNAFVIGFGLGFSILTAALTMILIILPIMIQVLIQNLQSIPNYYRFSAEALAIPKRIIILNLIIPYIFHGIIISIILSINKVISESAPLVLTMGTSVAFPNRGIFSAGRSLSTHIYLLQNENLSSNTEAITYQTAFLTLSFIFILNAFIHLFTRNMSKTKIKL